MESEEAERALRSMDQARARLATRARWSWQRHLAFGAVMGALVASYALAPVGQIIIVAACLLAIAAMVRRDRRRDGFFVNGYRRGRTRHIALLVVATFVVGVGAALIGRDQGLSWAPLASGLLLLVIATLASIAWERAYRSELEAGR